MEPELGPEMGGEGAMFTKDAFGSTDIASLVTTLSPAFLLQIMKLIPREDRCPVCLKLTCQQSGVQLL